MIVFVATVAVDTALSLPSLVSVALADPISVATMLSMSAHTYAVGPLVDATHIVHLSELTSVTVATGEAA